MYELTGVRHFEDLRSAFHVISTTQSGDPDRVCFGGLMEALAGFGAPVAITGVMLMSIGWACRCARRSPSYS